MSLTQFRSIPVIKEPTEQHIRTKKIPQLNWWFCGTDSRVEICEPTQRIYERAGDAGGTAPPPDTSIHGLR